MRDIKQSALNRVTVVGTLLSESSESITAKSTGQKYLKAKTLVQVRQPYHDKEEISEIEQEFFTAPLTRKGTENPSYKSVVALEESFVPADKSDMQSASRIKITGSLKENMYMSKRGRLVEKLVITGSFINEPKATETSDKATFSTEIFILQMIDEVIDEVETGRLIIKGVVVDYGPRANVFNFYVEEKAAIDFIKENCSINCTFPINGFIRSTTVESSKKHSSFGTDDNNITTIPVTEIIITGGDDPYDEDAGYDPLDIKKLMAQRKADKEQILESADRVKSARKVAASSGWDD